MNAAAMLTPNVGHGQAVAECGNASARAARSSVPRAPPTKIAAISRRSARGRTSLERRGGGAAPAAGSPRPDGYGTVRSADGSGTKELPRHSRTKLEAISRGAATVREGRASTPGHHLDLANFTSTSGHQKLA